MLKRFCICAFVDAFAISVMLAFVNSPVLAASAEVVPIPTQQQNVIFKRYVYCSALAAGAGITTKSALYYHSFGWYYFQRTEVDSQYDISPFMSPGYIADAAQVTVWVKGAGITYAAKTCYA